MVILDFVQDYSIGLHSNDIRIMAQLEWFETWFGTPYYHLLYNNRSQSEANEFITSLIHYLKPNPNAHMLDLACGQGRHAKTLSQLGFDVTGMDISTQSIQIANQSASDSLRFFVHDMRKPHFVNHFDYIFNFFTSFGYFENQQDNFIAAKNIATALKSKGIFVLDYLNSSTSALNLVPKEIIKRETTEFLIEKKIENGFFIKNITVNNHHYQEKVQAFEPSELIHIFENAGLSLKATFGNYKLEPFDISTSPRLILLFEK